jgi:hypothetical protein
VSWGITQKCDFVFYFSISIALYNAYRAKILRRKFCKDKQNWSSQNLVDLKLQLDPKSCVWLG